MRGDWRDADEHWVLWEVVLPLLGGLAGAAFGCWLGLVVLRGPILALRAALFG